MKCTATFAPSCVPLRLEVSTMSKLPTLPEVGRVVEVTRGRDRGMVAVVVRQEADRFVYVADGFKRTALRPKKKNVLHVRSTSHFSNAVLDEVSVGNRGADVVLRDAVNAYNASHKAMSVGDQEGVEPSGQR